MNSKEDENTLFVLADEYCYSAEQLEQSVNTNKVVTASYYLYGHALELAYKSFLFKNGIDIKGLIKIGHDLEAGLNKCIAFEIKEYLNFDEEYRNVVISINKYYSNKEFEYMSKTEKEYPHLSEVKAVVKKTISSVYNVIADY